MTNLNVFLFEFKRYTKTKPKTLSEYLKYQDIFGGMDTKMALYAEKSNRAKCLQV